VTVYLSVKQVLFLHMRLIEETGGAHGVRDLGLLRSAVARPHTTFAERELYPDLFYKAAALMHSLVLNHPMVDGNKRIGISAAAIFLELNGFVLSADQDEVKAFVLQVAQGRAKIDEIAKWLQAHCR